MNRDLPPLPENRKLTRITHSIVALAVGFGLGAGAVLRAGADELDDRRDELDSQIQEQNAAVEGASVELTKAVQAYEAAKSELSVAESELSAAETARAEAQELDKKRAEELAAAELKLEKAKADVEFAQAAYDVVDKRTTQEVNVIAQQNGGLLQLSLFVGDMSASQINQRAQLSDTLFSADAIELDNLTERRFGLENAKGEAEAAEKAADEARKAAAAQLEDTKAKEKAAEEKKAAVATKVTQRDEAQKAADAELVSEKTRQSELESESQDVDRRIQERNAERKRQEEEAARKAEEKRKAEEAARQAEQKSSSSSDSSGSSSSDSSSSDSSDSSGSDSSSTSKSSGGFIRPVAGRLSSPYGMRLHPVLGYWKLHDGTDFAASCGTPIKAAADGVVAEKYYNGGYGNRLMIDHGSHGGTYVTTGYNHATSYTVGVGDHVSQGQVIGYVGSTGYSTGCHLHLMVWEDGSKVNPMSRWFS